MSDDNAWRHSHWLKFTPDPQPGIGPVIGCQCGFMSDLDESSGWGDDVVAHIVHAAATDDTPGGDK